MLVILLFGNYQNVHADVFLQRYCNIRLSFISFKKKVAPWDQHVFWREMTLIFFFFFLKRVHVILVLRVI